jgi:bacterioferritin-associated ferredoxin
MKESTNLETGYLCHCLRITEQRFEEMLDQEPSPSYPLLNEKYGIGSMCSSCEYEAKGLLTEYLLLHPEKNGRKPRKGPRGLRADLRFAWKQLRERFSPSEQVTKERGAKPKLYHTGIFFMRQAGLESHLVVSNLRFPEHETNINGQAATFRARVFGEDGKPLAVSRPICVADGESLELTPKNLFPDVRGDFVGGLYVDYDELAQTGSLRPYGVLVNTAADALARCHYHDKFGLFRDPGYFQNTSPFEPGQPCWMALSNCQPIAYETEVVAKFGARKFAASLRVPPMANRWIKLEELFPSLDVPAAERAHGLFWLENPQHVMVYFFWFNERARTWMGQHH